MSRSPQNGGFHSCTGGSPFPPGVVFTACFSASIAAAVSPSRLLLLVRPCFAMFVLTLKRDWHDWCKSSLRVLERVPAGGSHSSGRHIVMPLIPRNAANVGNV